MGKLAFRDFDVIPEHFVVPHLQGFDAGARLLGRLVFSQPFMAFAGRLAEVIHLPAISRTDQAALLHGQRRLIHDRALYQRREVRKRRDGPVQLLQ